MTRLEKLGVQATVVGVFFSMSIGIYNTWDVNRKYKNTQAEIAEERRRSQSIDLSKGYADLMVDIVDYSFSDDLSTWELEEVRELKELLLSQYVTEVNKFNQALNDREDLLDYYSSLVTMRMNFNVLKSSLASNLDGIRPSFESNDQMRSQFELWIESQELAEGLSDGQKEKIWNNLVDRKSLEFASQVFSLYVDHIRDEGLYVEYESANGVVPHVESKPETVLSFDADDALITVE